MSDEEAYERYGVEMSVEKGFGFGREVGPHDKCSGDTTFTMWGALVDSTTGWCGPAGQKCNSITHLLLRSVSQRDTEANYIRRATSLCVFPMMLKRHSALLQEYSGGVAPSDKIWQTTETVWNALPAAEIARGFVLARRILGKVVSSNGDSSFLQGGKFHLNVQNDFWSTNKGILRNSDDTRI